LKQAEIGRMTKEEYGRKLNELDRLLNDPGVPIEPDRVWSLLAEISRESRYADGLSRSAAGPGPYLS
jgi:hypothetical protein